MSRGFCTTCIYISLSLTQFTIPLFYYPCLYSRLQYNVYFYILAVFPRKSRPSLTVTLSTCVYLRTTHVYHFNISTPLPPHLSLSFHTHFPPFILPIDYITIQTPKQLSASQGQQMCSAAFSLPFCRLTFVCCFLRVRTLCRFPYLQIQNRI